MANRFPLIVDSSNQNIKELPDGDSLLLGDSEKLILGDGTDLSLYHDGSNSYLTNATGALKLATESSGIAITIGHTTSETTIGDNLVITGDLSVGEMTLNADTLTASDDFIIDAVGDITLDAADNQIFFKDNGTTVGTVSMTDSNLKIISGVSDKDIILAGSDGGSEVIALTLDMSNGGRANFGNDIGLSDDRGIRFGNSDDLTIFHDGNNSFIRDSGTGSLYLQADAGVYITNAAGSENKAIFTSDGAVTLYHDNSAKLTTTSTGATTTGLHTSTTSANISQVAITSSSNAVAWDARAAANAYHVTTENTTFSAPSNSVEGAIISVELAQGGTARTIAWNTVFEFAASTAPTVTATANKTDIFAFRYNGSVWQEIGRVQNMAQT